MCRRHYGNVVLSDVDAQFQAVLVDIGEVVFGLFGVFMCHVQEHVVLASQLHLAVDGAGHHIARSERQTRVILLHKLLSGKVAQHGAIAAHGLGDEESGTVAGMIQRGGVELDKFHILHGAFGTIHHSDAVAGSNERVGGGLID